MTNPSTAPPWMQGGVPAVEPVLEEIPLGVDKETGEVLTPPSQPRKSSLPDPIGPLELRVMCGEVDLDRDAGRDLAFTEETLSEHMQVQASIYAYWGVLQQQAEVEVERAEFDAERIEAEVSGSIRAAANEKSVKMTEGTVSMMVVQDDRVKSSKLRVIDANHSRNMIKAVVRALEHKKDMMISIAMQRREELRTLRTNAVKEPDDIFKDTFGER